MQGQKLLTEGTEKALRALSEKGRVRASDPRTDRRRHGYS